MKVKRHPFPCYDLEAIDSDTVTAWVEVDRTVRVKWRIRLKGIEGGELDEPCGLASARATALALASNSHLSAHFFGNPNTFDKYGRHVGDIVFENGAHLTRQLFSTGLYWRRDRNGTQHKEIRT